MGLELDTSPSSRIFDLAPSPTEYLQNITPDNKIDPISVVMRLLATGDRTPDPSSLFEVSISARRRWWQPPGNLPERAAYRPPTLTNVAGALNALNPADLGIGTQVTVGGQFDPYVVRRGDSLRQIAQHFYRDANQSDRIWKANLDKIDNPNRIYPGQLFRIPRLEAK
jgi:hypothetical protein